MKIGYVLLMSALTMLAASCGGSKKERLERSALNQAIQANDTNLIAALAKQGVDISGPDQTGNRNTPLMWAIFEQKKEAFRTLLHLGADPNVQNRLGETALFYAVTRGSKDLEWLKLLLEANADVNIKNKYGSTVLSHALVIHPPEPAIVEVLRKAGAKEREDRNDTK